MKNRKKRKFKRILVIILLFLIILGLLFILLKDNFNKDKKNLKTVITTKKVSKVKVVDVNSKTRPYAVMINNNKAVWGYQAGLQDAYITYQIVVEGGITRMMALFKDKDTSRIASVRSARHYFLDYALENDAIYAHIGWSPEAQSDISSLGVDVINADNSNAFTWDSSLPISSEHTAYTSISKLKEAASKFGYKEKTNKGLLLNYTAEELPLSKQEGAISATTVKIPYSQSYMTSYVYDAVNKLYKRFQNGNAHTDYVTKAQYTAKNIITYKVSNYDLNDGEGKGRQGINNIGSGEGYYISSGFAVPITWEKTSRESKTIYKVKATGKALVVNDGNTFIEIEPSSQTLTIE